MKAWVGSRVAAHRLPSNPACPPSFCLQVVSDRSENHEGMGGMLLKESPVSQVRSIGAGG